LEHAPREPLLLTKQPEEQVLGADVVVLEVSSLVLAEDDDLTRSLGESLEQLVRSVAGRARCYRRRRWIRTRPPAGRESTVHVSRAPSRNVDSCGRPGSERITSSPRRGSKQRSCSTLRRS